MTNYWKGKNVLITGYEGFLGSNLTKRMLLCGAKVTGIDIKVNRKETILDNDDYKKIRVIKGNVANFRLIREIISRYKINVIFHLAAEAIVGRSLIKPIVTFSSNIEGTYNILEAVRLNGMVEAVVIASSDKAYGSHKKLPYKEDAPLIGNHPYDVSKSCADLISIAYHHTYGVPAAVTRCGNIYGPGDFNFSRIIPDTIRCILNNKTLFIRSDGEFTRDYVFVDDIVDGYIAVAEKLKRLNLGGEAFNFSNESPLTVKELVKKIYQTAKIKPDYVVLDQAKYEIKHQYLSSQKARNILGWKAKFSLEKGLKNTIEWYRDACPTSPKGKKKA